MIDEVSFDEIYCFQKSDRDQRISLKFEKSELSYLPNGYLPLTEAKNTQVSLMSRYKRLYQLAEAFRSGY